MAGEENKEAWVNRLACMGDDSFIKATKCTPSVAIKRSALCPNGLKSYIALCSRGQSHPLPLGEGRVRVIVK
jgi:hypothetical protein